MRRQIKSLVCSCVLFLAVALLPGQAPNPIRVQVVTGGHDYETSFYSLFMDVPGLVWHHATSNTQAFARDIRSGYDVLVLYDLSKEIAEKQKSNLQAFVEGGKGLVVLHHAIADYGGWPWWYREVVGGRYLLEADGNLPASTYQHDQEVFAKVVSQHPVTEGVGDLHLRDETYKGLWISPDVNVLMRTDNPTSDGPLVWISPYGKSRVVYIELGHGPETHQNAGYRRLVRNAIFWAAGRGTAGVRALRMGLK
ncbi:MAG: ThuA domain-containing protein [Acidobacteriota bacterium]